MKTPLIERMTKGGAAKAWIKEVEAKDREIERLEQTKDQYLNTIDLLAREKEQLEEIAEQAVLDHSAQERVRELEAENAALKRENEAFGDFANTIAYTSDGKRRSSLGLTFTKALEDLRNALLTAEEEDDG